MADNVHFHDVLEDHIGLPPQHYETDVMSDSTGEQDPRLFGPGFSYSRRSSRQQEAGIMGDQDPRLFGPGYSRPASPQVVPEPNVRYVLVTPDMLQAMNSGLAPDGRIINNVLPSTLPEGVTPAAVHPSTPDLQAKHGSVAHFEHLGSQEEIGPAAKVEEIPYLVNPIARLRWQFKEYLGEFIGTMILIIFGNGVNCQVVLSEDKQGSYLSISFGWGIGVMFGVYSCGGISGGHINPAVTIALATFRGFPWKKVPGYILAQVLGGWMGSSLIQGNYHALLNKFEGGYNMRTYGAETSTAALFFTDAKPYMTNAGAFFSELFATAVLMGIILCLSDKNNHPAPQGMNGVFLLWLIVGIGAALGTQTAYCLNPARDLGPRIACACFGFPKQIWTYRHCYWIYVPIIATILGALIGAFVYDLFIYQGKESPLNRPWGRKAIKKARENVPKAHVPEGSKNFGGEKSGGERFRVGG